MLNLIAPLDGMKMLPEMQANTVPSALEVAKYNGKLYGFPTSLKNVALYYNKSIVKEVPKDTDSLLTAAGGMVSGPVKYGLALNTGFYNAVGYNFAFGGKLFTDNTHVDLTQQGTIDWLNWMKKAKGTTGVLATTKGDDITNAFKTGEAAMVIDGPWALGDYQKALGADKVGVAMAPGTPSGGKFAPFVGTENYYVNASSKNQDAALAFVNYIQSPGVAQNFVQTRDRSPQTPRSISLATRPCRASLIRRSQGSPFPNFPADGQGVGSRKQHDQ